MSLAILYVDDQGQPAIDAYAVMQTAIDLYFDSRDPSQIDIANVTSGIEDFHSRLFSVATTLLARAPATETLRPKPTITSVTDNVIEADFTPVAPIAPTEAAPEVVPQITEEVLVRSPPSEVVGEAAVQPRPTIGTTKARRAKLKIVPRATVPVETPVADVATPKRRRADLAPATPKLPRRLSKVEDALRMDKIICLEDGKAVVDLGRHLDTIGMSRSEYLAKWGLPATYPMKAPSLIMKHGTTYEYDPMRNRMIRA
jgi:hypothetical protein